jgi:hypothetical protein
LVIGFGVFRFVNKRHPRVLARIRPTQLGVWSFAVAVAHGAGLMLVPIYLGLCRAADLDKGHEAAGAHKRQFGHGCPGLRRPLCRDDRSRRTLSVAGLSLPGSEVRVAELVQSGYYLGLQSRLCRRSIASCQPGERALSRVALGLTVGARLGCRNATVRCVPKLGRNRSETACRLPPRTEAFNRAPMAAWHSQLSSL